MRLAIVGSVRLAGNARAYEIIRAALAHYQPSVVVSGGAVGIDSMAAECARELGIEVREYLPSVRKFHGAGGYAERNLKIAGDCDVLLRIVARSSKTYGSGWTRDRAKKLGVVCVERIVEV